MTTIRTLIATICIMALASFVLAQDTTPKRVTPADAKNHIGERATVCGKVVDTKIPKYGLAGHGKPVTFYLDQTEPNAVFYFVTFGSESGGPQEAAAAYNGKSVCVTGKIDMVSSGGPPFIMAANRSQIKPETAGK
jgi:hypothetical protein